MRKRTDLGQPSDIAFLLIIFFLLLAGINTTQSIALHTKATTAPQTGSVVVQALLTREGTVVLENETHTPFSFAQKLTNGTNLYLQVEAETSWQQVVDLLSLTEQRRIAGLSLTLADSTSTANPLQGEGIDMGRQQQGQKKELLKQGDTRIQAGTDVGNARELDL